MAEASQNEKGLPLGDQRTAAVTSRSRSKRRLIAVQSTTFHQALM
jgi:hypothetical protein